MSPSRAERSPNGTTRPGPGERGAVGAGPGLCHRAPHVLRRGRGPGPSSGGHRDAGALPAASGRAGVRLGEDALPDLFRWSRFSLLGPAFDEFAQSGDWAAAVRAAVGENSLPAGVAVGRLLPG